ncbi:MAG: Hpt domain-containing protein [Desulfobulbaceae bacterium]|nr:Hpt domain-containing protein [Desulfobulbaceae bacterium]
MSELIWDREFALEQAGQDEELLAELVQLFNDTSADDVAKIQAALSAGDAQGMADAAHSIKGAAASMGIEDIRKAAHEIEKSGRNEDVDSAGAGLPDLEDLLGQFKSLT